LSQLNQLNLISQAVAIPDSELESLGLSDANAETKQFLDDLILKKKLIASFCKNLQTEQKGLKLFLRIFLKKETTLNRRMKRQLHS
jgi:hypothetical protein